MPSRSPQRSPPRSPLRPPGRSTPCRARRLAGRAGSRHRHPLPYKQDNKANVLLNPCCCQMPDDKKIRAIASSFRTTLSEIRSGPTPPGAGSSRLPPDLSAADANAELPDPGHVKGWILAWLEVLFDRGEHVQRRVTAAPASPRPTRRARRGGRCPLPSLRPPGVCPRETPARFHRGPGTAGRHAGRAGRPAAESLAASPRRSRRACGHCPAPGEPRTARSATVTGSRVGARSARGVRSGRARRPSGKSRLPSSWPARGIHPRAFRDRLAKASGAAPGHGGAPQA